MTLVNRSRSGWTGVRRRVAAKAVERAHWAWWSRAQTAARAAKKPPRFRKVLDGWEWLVGYLVVAVALLVVLIWAEPELTREVADLAERLLSVLAAGGMLFSIVANSGLNQLRATIGSANPPGSPVAWSRGPKQIKRCWQLALLLVSAWLLAATAHLASAYVYIARDQANSLSLAGFADELAKSSELQLLAGEVVLLVGILMAVAIEEAFRKNNNAVVRIYLVVLAYIALMLSSISHIPEPLSVYGWLIAWHVSAFAAWMGLAFLLRISRDSDPRFLRVAAQQFSQLAAVMSVVVLVTGGALGTGWASEHFSKVFITLPGWALMIKVLIGLVLTLGIGYAHRRWSLPQLAEAPDEEGRAKTALLWRLGLAELIGMAMATTFGIIL